MTPTKAEKEAKAAQEEPKKRELEFIDYKGGKYLPVAQRLIWFRDDHLLWGIETELVKLEDKYAIAKTAVKDEQGRVIATAHKREDAQSFPDFMEKAETGSVGRALAMCGYGTQFAPEFDEGSRIVDSPAASHAAPADRPEQKPAASGGEGELITIKSATRKPKKTGTGDYVSVDTGKGWMSVFDEKLFDKVLGREGETIVAAVKRENGFSNITAIND